MLSKNPVLILKCNNVRRLNWYYYIPNNKNHIFVSIALLEHKKEKYYNKVVQNTKTLYHLLKEL